MTDEITQAEKKQVLLKDCYLSRAVADADQSGGGRWKKQSETSVTGVPQYPRQPSNSPFAKSLDELTGREGPFEVDIEFVGVLGGASAPLAAVETTPPEERGGLSSTPVDDPPQPTRRRRF